MHVKITEEERKARNRARWARYYTRNREKVCARQALRQAANPAAQRIRAARYRAAHRVRNRERNARRYAANREGMRAYYVRYRAANIVRMRAYGRLWYRLNREKAKVRNAFNYAKIRREQLLKSLLILTTGKPIQEALKCV